FLNISIKNIIIATNIKSFNNPSVSFKSNCAENKGKIKHIPASTNDKIASSTKYGFSSLTKYQHIFKFVFNSLKLFLIFFIKLPLQKDLQLKHNITVNWRVNSFFT